jgi:hypothetical protein
MSDDPLPRHVVAGWVRAQRLAPAAKLVLLLVFDHAGPQEDGRWVAWAGLNTLALEAGFAEGANGARTVRRHLADMEAAGLIEREERRRTNGSQTTSRVVLLVRVDSADPPDGADPGGRTDESGGGGLGSPGHPKPQDEAASRSPTATRTARAKANDTLPDDFPAEFVPHARGVYRVLREVAEQHNAKPVTVRGVGLAIMGNPGYRYVAEAYKLASWSQTSRQVKDAVGTYRQWLTNADQCAGVEQVDDRGYPAASPLTVAAGGNVTPMRGRRGQLTAADLMDAGRALGGQQ